MLRLTKKLTKNDMKTFKISEKIGKLLKSAKQELSSFSIMI